MIGNDRAKLRRMYADAWRKFCANEILSPLDAQISAVVEEHPEYHQSITGDALEVSFSGEDGNTNPFLHMGLHLALREQVSTDRPAGIAAIHQDLSHKHSDQHAAEHQMLEVLAETLWEAQSGNCPPDESEYLQRLRRLS